MYPWLISQILFTHLLHYLAHVYIRISQSCGTHIVRTFLFLYYRFWSTWVKAIMLTYTIVGRHSGKHKFIHITISFCIVGDPCIWAHLVDICHTFSHRGLYTHTSLIDLHSCHLYLNVHPGTLSKTAWRRLRRLEWSHAALYTGLPLDMFVIFVFPCLTCLWRS